MLISAHTNLTVALGCDGVTLVISLKVAVRYCEICTVVAMSFVGGAISTLLFIKWYLSTFLVGDFWVKSVWRTDLIGGF